MLAQNMYVKLIHVHHKQFLYLSKTDSVGLCSFSSFDVWLVVATYIAKNLNMTIATYLPTAALQ